MAEADFYAESRKCLKNLRRVKNLRLEGPGSGVVWFAALFLRDRIVVVTSILSRWHFGEISQF